MKIKPWPIIVLALLHFLAPVGNIILNSVRAGRSFDMTWDYWYNALPKPLFFAYVIAPPLAGVFIFICKRWSYWCYVGCLGFIFIANAYSFWTSMNWLNFLTLVIVLLIDIVAVAYFVVPSVRKVYFDPKMRWWETAPRYIFNTMGVINGLQANIRNISEGGAFVEVQGCTEGESVDLLWQHESEKFHLKGKTVYCKPQGSSFGCGVKFDHNEETQKAMRELVTKLHKDGKMIRDRLPGPEDTFGAWLKKLVQTRQGLFPK